MILVCPGYERDDGTKVHEEVIELSRAAPTDRTVVNKHCFECRGELLKDMAEKIRGLADA